MAAGICPEPLRELTELPGPQESERRGGRETNGGRKSDGKTRDRSIEEQREGEKVGDGEGRKGGKEEVSKKTLLHKRQTHLRYEEHNMKKGKVAWAFSAPFLSSQSHFSSGANSGLHFSLKKLTTFLKRRVFTVTTNVQNTISREQVPSNALKTQVLTV